MKSVNSVPGIKRKVYKKNDNGLCCFRDLMALPDKLLLENYCKVVMKFSFNNPCLVGASLSNYRGQLHSMILLL